jgi:hypothetical protein
MEQDNEELNWRDAAWSNDFFDDFIRELPLCYSENLEPSPQNTEEYNSTRERCQFILNYYLTRVERIVNEMEGTETPRDVVDNIIDNLQRVVTQPIFQGIVDQTTERVAEEFGEGVVNPMLQGNNQEWSELSLVNHFNKLYDYYMRVFRYDGIRENNSVSVGGKRRNKYRKIKKSKKANKKNKKAKNKSRKVNKKKSRKAKK